MSLVEPAKDGKSAQAEPASGHPERGLWTLTLGSVGVVYGDIGTSPLYALREALNHAAGDGISRAEVLGVVSLLLWSLVAIVTLKYVFLMLRLDNRGEGGILSLVALAHAALGRRTTAIFVLGVLGAGLFYGDAVITPAISVLSAVEGLGLATPVFEPFIVPIAVAILVVLFAVQYRGTGAVASWFGPVMVLWFSVMAALGVAHIADDPAILRALDPSHAVRFLAGHGVIGFVVLGAVFLAVTGAEALYADMGHFGRRPMRIAWLGLVFPALALNYLGQGALVLADPAALRNPFFLLAPEWGLLPLVALATLATVIASQAVITGAYSLTRQALHLGLLPRLEVRHTSETQPGQIYMPKINWLLLAGVLALVLVFENSSALAGAYGIAVSGTMLVTTALAFIVLRHLRRWPLARALLAVAPFAAIEAIFLAANLLKLPEGGYVPIALAALLMAVMWTWVRGTRILFEKTHKENVPLADLAPMLARSAPHVTPGTAVFLTSDPEIAPPALLHNLKHNRVLHARNIVLTVLTADAPRVAEDRRIAIEKVDDRFTRLACTFGYMETPNLPRALRLARREGLEFDPMATSFFLGRRSVRPGVRSGMPAWQDKMYIGLLRAAANATDFYRLPPGRVVELGQQLTV